MLCGESGDATGLRRAEHDRESDDIHRDISSGIELPFVRKSLHADLVRHQAGLVQASTIALHSKDQAQDPPIPFMETELPLV